MVKPLIITWYWAFKFPFSFTEEKRSSIFSFGSHFRN
jgi:hypothetical protein